MARVNGPRDRRIYGHARLHEPVDTRASKHVSTVEGERKVADTRCGERGGESGRRETLSEVNERGRGKQDRAAEHVIRADSLMALTRRIDAPFHAHVSVFSGSGPQPGPHQGEKEREILILFAQTKRVGQSRRYKNVKNGCTARNQRFGATSGGIWNSRIFRGDRHARPCNSSRPKVDGGTGGGCPITRPEILDKG